MSDFEFHTNDGGFQTHNPNIQGDASNFAGDAFEGFDGTNGSANHVFNTTSGV